MPCNSDYLNASGLEIELSRVLLLTQELETGKPVDTRSSDWMGYMTEAYGKADLRAKADAAVANLCDRLKKVDVTQYSLEMQVWWRDHQAADKRREAEEKEKDKKTALRASAIKKLTPAERKALGL